jgi:hypothetical protein
VGSISDRMMSWPHRSITSLIFCRVSHINLAMKQGKSA